MSRKFLIDAAERIAATAVEAAVAVVLLSGTLDLSTGKKAAVAGTMAGLTAVKTLLAKFTGSADSAAVGQ